MIILTTDWPQLISNNILGFAQVLGSFATAGALIAMIINNKQQRQQWLNDAFAKKEAQLWIEFREKFHTLTYDFLFFIECIPENRNYRVSEERYKKFFQKETEGFIELRRIYRLMMPYFIEKEFKSINKLLFELYAICDKIKDNSFFIKDDFDDKDENYFVDIKCYNKIASEIIFRTRSFYEFKKDIKEADEAIKLLTSEIDSINEALNKKITAHLKDK